MNRSSIETQRLRLSLDSLEETRARIDAMSADDKVGLSAEWLSLLASATTSDPWVLGFSMKLRDGDIEVGQCGFKGPPCVEGIVEIAYGVAEEYEGMGYATEAAAALVAFAFGHEEVRGVRAHTLPESNASTRVLTKCNFRKVGEVIDPEDGPVWRWDRKREES